MQFIWSFRLELSIKIRYTVANNTPDKRPRKKSKWPMPEALKAGSIGMCKLNYGISWDKQKFRTQNFKYDI